MDYRTVLERAKKAERCKSPTAKTAETHLSVVSAVAETADPAGRGMEREGFRGFCGSGNRFFEFNKTPVAQTPRAKLMAEADAAGDAVASEPPRSLEPQEKASIAMLCRREYGSHDDEIADTISEADELPAKRGYLLQLANAAGCR